MSETNYFLLEQLLYMAVCHLCDIVSIIRIGRHKCFKSLAVIVLKVETPEINLYLPNNILLYVLGKFSDLGLSAVDLNHGFFVNLKINVY